MSDEKTDVMVNMALVHEIQDLQTKLGTVEEETQALHDELEHERMRLAACGVAADQNTPMSRELHRLPDDSPYQSGSYTAVCAAVDREIALRHELDQAKLMAKAAQTQADEALRRLDNGGWIPIEQRPEGSQVVLTFSPQWGYSLHNADRIDFEGSITHWMPMPADPRVVEGQVPNVTPETNELNKKALRLDRY